jgi:TonB family protein
MHRKVRLLKWWYAMLTCALLSVQAGIGSAQNAPGPASTLQAHVAWAFNPIKRCPDLRVAEDGTAAVVVFLVARSGVPSRVSIKSSSRSEALDAAAMSCVLKLRFDPATRLGDGEPIDSWQEIAWTWASQERRGDTHGIATQTPASKANQDSTASMAAPNGNITSGSQDGSHSQDRSVAVRVCADDAGKLLQDPTILRSSGNPGFDEAAVKIAKSGSPYYRPGTDSNKKPVSGCAQLTIEFETQ